jgi:nucleoside-diphosphate-sugar epimerase
MSLIDVRDVASFTVSATERRLTGSYVATSMPGQTTYGEFFELCRAATGSDARPRWTPDERVTAAGIEPWTELPLWIPMADAPNIWYVDAARAHAAGLAPRPLPETIADTWAWMQSGVDESDGYGSHRVVDLDPAREAAVLGG